MNIRETICQIEHRLNRLNRESSYRLHTVKEYQQNQYLQHLREENLRLLYYNTRITCYRQQLYNELEHYEYEMQRYIDHKAYLLERMKTLECLLENRSVESKFCYKLIKLMKKRRNLHYDPCLKECWYWIKQLTKY